MKKLIFTFFLAFLALSAFASEEVEIYKGKIIFSDPLIGNMKEADFALTFDPETNKYFLVFASATPRFMIEFSESQLKQLISIFDKYKEWEEIAVSNQVEIDKPIPDGTIKTTAYWYTGDSWYISSHFELKSRFVSQSKQKHYLKLSAEKVRASKNNDIDFRMDFLFFTKEQASAFINGISEERIQKAKRDYKKKKEAGSMFN